MPLSGVLEQLFDYWKSLPRDGGVPIPARQNLLPTDLHDVLPRLSLLKRQQRYQVNVSMIGTANNASWRSPIIGMNAFDLTAPAMRENSAKLYAAILDQPCAAIMKENITSKSGKVRCIQSLYLPMTDRDGKSSYIVGCSSYRRKPCYSNTNDRLMPAHSHVIDVEFIDIGRGLPDVQFEQVEPVESSNLSFQWWQRFLPDKRKPKPDFKSQRHTIESGQHSASWLTPAIEETKRKRLDA
ncbi:MAG: PAS domain-containing protein [Kordiimonadaceae bacterium]|nr:PAS domain-containing protein [Kordiimonadaceae bacterium]MBO6569083.1 PAS domain-containing protein [Kordiimonadaceae bacterium]MBO6964558.1 PAS domain-containing protein [Kordiimonadaceae bacterium]